MSAPAAPAVAAVKSWTLVAVPQRAGAPVVAWMWSQPGWESVARVLAGVRWQR